MYDSTNPDWVPSLKMGYETPHTQDLERYNRLQLRKKRKVDAAAEDADLDTGVACQTDVDKADVACQTDIGMFEITKMEAELPKLKENNQRLQIEISEAKQQVQRASFSAESLQNDEQKLKFYTGKLPCTLSYAIMLVLFRNYLLSSRNTRMVCLQCTL